ncbi:Holliday junction resolvase RuvX [Rhodococcus aerolatus]
MTVDGPDRTDPDRPGHDDPGRGRRLGVDVGSVRVGVAVSDPDGLVATPVETVARQRGSTRPDAPDLLRVAALAAEHDCVEVVVGLPRTLRAEHGAAAQSASRYARLLGERVDPVPVRLSDERFTTVTATRTLAERGVRGARQRAVIDQAAAVAILQGWLDGRRRTLAAAAAADVEEQA